MSAYDQFVLDVATRTRANLLFIETAKARGEDVFEVTQLINSLLGMLVFVQQKKDLPDTALSELDGFPVPEFVQGEKLTTSFSSFVKYCRHAIAHGHVEAEPKGEGLEITHLLLKNRPNERTPFNWEIKCSIEDVRGIALYLVKFINDEVGLEDYAMTDKNHNMSEAERLTLYRDQIDNIRDLKANQWKMSHYGLLAQAALVGVFQVASESYNASLEYFFMLVGLVAMIAAMYFIDQFQETIKGRRISIDYLADRPPVSFSYAVKHLRTHRKHRPQRWKADRQFLVLFSLVQALGWLLEAGTILGIAT